MKEGKIFDQFEFARNLTLLVAKETNEEKADVIFNGFQILFAGSLVIFLFQLR